MDAYEPQLARTLHARHIQLIALGGTIGVGLFLGSAKAIHQAGPGLLLAYLIGGGAVFFIMRALGELLTYRPVSGSFVAYAEEFCGPFVGFITGWSYWFMWVVVAMAELTAIGIYVRHWFPNVPQWLPALLALLLLYSTNLLAVRTFGELEFWFALVKVVAIVAFIVVGLAVILLHVGELGPTAGFSNLYSHGGFLPFGIVGVLLAMQIVLFAYTGVELLGVTAGEAEDPRGVLPSATNSIIVRILLFYIGSLAVMMSVVPWSELNPDVSPFVFLFEKLHVHAAAGIITLVIITAAASSCNSGLYSTGRMLWTLAQQKQAPLAFTRLNARSVPSAGIHASAAVMLIVVVLNLIVPEQAFAWITSITLIGTLWTWGIIMIAHRNYRRAVAAGDLRPSSFRMPLSPFANWLVIALLATVACMLALNEETRVALYFAPVWFGLLSISYRILQSRSGDRHRRTSSNL
jgi:AAT family amino acid transporter